MQELLRILIESILRPLKALIGSTKGLVNRNNIIQITLSVTILGIAVVNLVWTRRRDDEIEKLALVASSIRKSQESGWELTNKSLKRIQILWGFLLVDGKPITDPDMMLKAFELQSNEVSDFALTGFSTVLSPSDTLQLFRIQFKNSDQLRMQRLTKRYRVEFCACVLLEQACAVFSDGYGLGALLKGPWIADCPTPPYQKD